ncbi:MAG: GDP-mannose 4,6 dehydratase [Archaeoglobales archaeon]|nr:MAG: GDP-mannose 4,6 dehydratase [Archaeoglobales archaeon]
MDVYLITGATGFVGPYVIDYLCSGAAGPCEIHCTYRYRSRKTVPKSLVRFLPNYTANTDVVVWHECDLMDAHSVRHLFEWIKPTRVIHLAAMSYVPQSWDSPKSTLETNIGMQVNLLEAARVIFDKGVDCRVHCCGSSEEYGYVVPGEVPISEDSPLRPLSPYGVSKVTQDYLGYQYHESYGLFTVRTRAFNHLGPGRGKNFAESAFTLRALEAYASQDKTIHVGNLDAVRDYTDVRDTVRAYVDLLNAEPETVCGQVFNVASGVGHSMSDLLRTICFGIGGSLDVWWSEVEDPRYLRPSDVPLLIGGASKLHDAIGWEPTIGFVESVGDLISWWQEETGL